MPIVKFLIGKNGLTEGFMKNIENYFKTNKSVKIYVLKSARPEGKDGKTEVEKYEKKILERLGKNYISRTIGFTINLKKWKKFK